jgi:hypothetical protein
MEVVKGSYPWRDSRGVRYSSETPSFYQNFLAMSNTADVTGGKPIAVWSQSISGVNAFYPIVFFISLLRHPVRQFIVCSIELAFRTMMAFSVPKNEMSLISLICKNYDHSLAKACHCVAFSKIIDKPVNGRPSLFCIDCVLRIETSLSHALYA